MPLAASRKLLRPALALPIIRLALPIMIQGILMTLMGFVDSLMIGQLGEGAIAGLGNASQLTALTFLLFAALSAGGAILIAQHSGAGQKSALNNLMQSMISAGWLGGVLMAVLFFCFADELLALLTTDIFKPRSEWSQVPAIGGSYLRIIAFALPFMLLSQMCAAAFNSTGNTRTPVKVALLFNLVNFIGNYLLIFDGQLPGMTQPLFTPLGLRGAAIATLLASTGQGIVLLALLNKRYPLKRLHKPQWQQLKQIIAIGYPNTIDGFYWQGARVFYTVLMNTIGAIAYAGYTIVRTFKGLFILPVSGLQQATGIYIGQLLGAGKFQKARASALSAIVASLLMMTIPVLLLILLAHPLLGLYKIAPQTYELAYTCIWILSFSLYFTGINSVIPGVLRAGGDTRAVMNITLISFVLIGAPASFLLGIVCDFGLIGAFIGITLEEIIKALLFIRRMKQMVWLNNLVGQTPSEKQARPLP